MPGPGRPPCPRPLPGPCGGWRRPAREADTNGLARLGRGGGVLCPGPPDGGVLRSREHGPGRHRTYSFGSLESRTRKRSRRRMRRNDPHLLARCHPQEPGDFRRDLPDRSASPSQSACSTEPDPRHGVRPVLEGAQRQVRREPARGWRAPGESQAIAPTASGMRLGPGGIPGLVDADDVHRVSGRSGGHRCRIHRRRPLAAPFPRSPKS